MTIKQKVVGAAIAKALLVAVVGVICAISLLQMAGNLRHTVRTELPEIQNTGQLVRAISVAHSYSDKYVADAAQGRRSEATADKATVDAGLKDIARLIGVFRAAADEQMRMAATRADAEDARADLEHITTLSAQCDQLKQDWLKVTSSTAYDAPTPPDSALILRLEDHIRAATSLCLDLDQGARNDTFRLVNAAADQAMPSVRTMAFVAVAAVILVLLIGYFVAVPLATRLSCVRQAAVELGKGNLNARIDPGTNDEIGQLVVAFNGMAAALARSHAAIQRSEEKYRSLFDSSPDAIMTSEPPSGTFTSGNAAALRMFGARNEEEFTAVDAIQLSPDRQPDGRTSAEKAKEMIETAMREGQIFFEWTHKRIGGEEFPATVLLSRVRAGGKVFLQATVRDITQQKQVEEELEQNRKQLEEMVHERTIALGKLGRATEESPAIVFIANKDGQIEYVNPKFVEVTGYALEEVKGQTPRLLKSGVHPQEFYAALWKTIISGQTWHGEVCNRRKNGELYWESGSISSLKNTAGAITHFVAVKEDVTAKHSEQLLNRALEAAEAANRAKSEFLARMSHEIRTPLNGVIGMVDLLAGSQLTSEQAECAQLARSSATALLDLVNDVLDFSKIEAGKLELEQLPFELHATVEGPVAMLAPRAAAKGLELASFVDAAGPTYLLGDAQRLRQILINLLSNAVKFTNKGHVTVRVAVEERFIDRIKLRFDVSDTGIGIPDNRMDRLFQSFSQIDSSTTRQYGGTGLGLAICGQLVRLMGGRIDVHSRPGEGSTFWFTVDLPVANAPVSASPTASTADAKDLRVLVVSANAALRQCLTDQLTAWGVQGAAAATADEALAALRNAPADKAFSVALIDVPILTTPGGESIASQIYLDQTIRTTALLLLTPAEAPLAAKQLRSAGFTAQVPKPVRQSQLLDRLMEALTLFESSTVKTTPPAEAPAQVEQVHTVASGVRILVAEDNLVNQKVAAKYLERAGYQYAIADNGKQALEMILTGQYQLVLMDCHMPVMDGFETTRLVRQAEAEGKRTAPVAPRLPIVALTANAVKGDREVCLAAGMDEYLSKPLNPTQLVAMIEAMLSVAATVGTPHDRAPLNYAAALEGCLNDLSMLVAVVDEFECQVANDLTKLTESLRLGDAAGIQNAAHRLKGSARYLRAESLSSDAQRLEDMGRSRDLNDAAPLIERLRHESSECVRYARGCATKAQEHAEIP